MMKKLHKSLLAMAVLVGLSLGKAAWAADSDPVTYGQVKEAVKGLTYDSVTKKISFTTIDNPAAIELIDLNVLNPDYIAIPKVEIDSSAIAYGTGSIALGYGAKVIGASGTTDRSIAIGHFAKVTSAAAVAMGYEASAEGLRSVAIGSNAKTTADAQNSLALGHYASANQKGSVAIGSYAVTSLPPVTVGNVTTYEFSVGGGNDGTNTIYRRITGVADGVNDYDAVNMKQLQSAISGGGGDSLWFAGQSGTGSIRMAGGSNVATGDYAIAMGKESTASGAESTAMGYKSTAGANYSLAAGYGAKTEGGSSLAVGADTYAKGYASVALGDETRAEGNQSVALGYKTKATARASTAIGYGSEALGEGSFAGGGKGSTGDAMGQKDGGKAYGLNSFAFGMGAVAGVSGAAVDYAGTIAMGNDAKAIHKNSVALGNNSVTVADYTLAVGDVSNSVFRRITGLADGTAATDAATVAQAYSLWSAGTAPDSVKMTVGNNAATSVNAIAMGKDSTASGQAAVAMGYEAIAGANYSLAVGHGSKTGGGSSVAIGAGAKTTGFAAVSLGSGTIADTNAVALGYNTNAKGRASTAVGYGSEAIGEGSFAGGGHVLSTQVDGAKAYGENSFAFGTGAVAGMSDGTGDFTFAFGNEALAKMDNAIAFGSGAKAEHENSVALGSNSVTSAMNTISVGYSGGERRITNVANGTADTDAATVGQLNAKADYYVKSGSVRDDVSTGKKYIDLKVFDYSSSTLFDTVSIDVSNVGGGSVVTGDKTLTAGKNIGFTEYVDPADSTTKYAVGLLDNIAGITSAEIGTTAKNVHLTNDGMTVTDNSDPSSTKTAGVTAEKVYVSSDGTVYSELNKTELKVNAKTYIDEDGINANGQKITNVAAGTTTYDAVNYGQISGAFVDASYSDNVLTLTQIDGGTKTVTITSGGEATELVHKGSNASAVMIGKNTEATGQDALAFGNYSKANASEAVAVGYNNTVTGEKSTAVGNYNTVSGARSGAFGDPNTVTGSGSYAFGNDNTISGNNTFVLGNSVNSSSSNSVILGHGSADGGNNTVSVGAPGAERKIVNVARATVGTDAVNLDQVNALLGTTGTGETFYALKDEVAGIHSKVERLGTRINKVGAGAAALAAMHPVYDEDSKITFSAGLGAYRNEKAAALGAFYRFSDRVFMNCGATVGNDNNMYNIGLNFALDRHVGSKLPSKAVMARELAVLREKTAEQDAKIAKLTAMLQELLEKNSIKN